MFGLAAEARRLRGSLAVAQRWYETALEGDEAGYLTSQAEYTRDQIEEELSRTAFKMEVSMRRGQLGKVRPEEDPDKIAGASVLSDSLLRAYCALRDVPAEVLGVDASDQDRYAIMGAMMAAMDTANAQMERRVQKEE